MKMKKQFFLLLLLSFLVSCNELIDKPDLQSLPSTSINLSYPAGNGTSGDAMNGLIGYGYDATGFCDTISVRAKIFESLPGDDIFFGNPNTISPTLVSGGSYAELLNKINNPNIITESGKILTIHLESLMKLAFKSDSIEPDYAYTYYAITYYNSHRKFYTGSDNQQYLTADFKSDAVSLSPKELVSKYGTHVLTEVFTGTKFEVLYRCKFGNPHNGSDCENLFQNRMKEYAGGTPGIINDINKDTKLSQTNEQLIYNSTGSNNKLCGLISATDYNPDSIRLDISSIFSEKNIKTQFISVGNDGILPVYELINDATKKQEVKAYIEKYMSAKTVN